MIDINRSTQDIHYRYKMPVLQIKHEGKNTGIKTILLNLDDISNSLKRNSDLIVKYLACELSLQIKNDKNKYVISGKHECSKLQDLIFDFIDIFVLCQKCNNPETFFILENNLSMECLACGYKSQIGNHKIVPYIIKNVNTPVTIYSNYVNEEQEEGMEVMYEKYKSSGVKDEEIFVKCLETCNDTFEKCEFIVKKCPYKTILSEFEKYVEANKCYSKIKPFLDFLISVGIKKNDISKAYSRPPSGRKRSLEFKKEINSYFN